MTEPDNTSLSPGDLLGALNDGVYATDLERRIVYWGPSAERITGWRSEDVLGKRCSDDVLSHVDKEGRRLCGSDTCPLHRAIATDHGSEFPIIVFARREDGQRIPMRTSVAPIRNATGEVIGGIETFRDVSEEFHDGELAKRIQSALVSRELPNDPRVTFASHYVPWGMIGGDYYAAACVDEDRIAFVLADVCGHGLAAAMYTVYLDALWQGNPDLLKSPGELAGLIGGRICELSGDDTRFVTAVFGLLDLEQMRTTLAFAGGPPIFLFRSGQPLDVIEDPGLPLGCLPDAEYEQRTVDLRAGDCLLAFSDGALEIPDADQALLEKEGLARVLDEVGYPASGSFNAIEKKLLKYSNRIRFDDDLTFLEVRLT